jgi:hypothetical protein
MSGFSTPGTQILNLLKLPNQQIVQMELTCVLADNHEAITFTNMKYPASQDKIVAASYIRVPVADKANKERPIVLLGRKFSFFYLCVDALSFDSKTSKPDPLWSNVSDNQELAGCSYLYNALWDALLFGTVHFDEGDNLKKSKLKVETHWTPGSSGSSSKTSHYQSGGIGSGTIRLTTNHSGYDDNSRFTVLHEFGHHFDCMTNNGKFRAVNLDTSGNLINHGGYMNPSTADSFEEGLATAYAIFVQDYRGDKNPYMAGNFNLSSPGNYVSWKANGKFEELAISILLWDVYKGYKNKADYWKLLKPDYANFYKYYQAIETDTPLRTPPENLILGKSSDASRDRETIELIPESYLHFANMTDEVAENISKLIVEIKPKNGEDSKQLLPLEGNKIYLGLTSRLQKGEVIVSIPGGLKLFEGDLEELQMIRDTNYGLNVPLDVVDLADFDQDDLTSFKQATFDLNEQKYELWPCPCEGSTKSDELIKLPSSKLITQGNKQADFKASSVQAHITPEYLADIENGRLQPHPLRLISKIAFIYAIIQLITAAAVIAILIWRKRT